MANANDIDASAFIEDGNVLIFSPFADVIRSHIGEGENEMEALVSSVLERNQNLDGVQFDAPLNGSNPMEMRVFDALISRLRMQQLIFPATLEPSSIPALIRRAMPILRQKQTDINVAFTLAVESDMTAAEADEIFGLLQRFTTPHCVSICLTEFNEAAFSAFVRCIQESAAMAALTLGATESGMLAEAPFRILCEAIGKSSSLQILCIAHSIVQEEHVGEATGHLANAIATNDTLTQLLLDPTSTDTFKMDQMCQALSHTTAVRNFDLCFWKVGESVRGIRMLEIDRGSCPFKQVLSQDVPLGLWPRILAKAGTGNWSRLDSHSPLDFVFLLAKEKNDVLFRDATQRRETKTLSGQKRKREDSSAA